jgi:hypothetical protein
MYQVPICLVRFDEARKNPEMNPHIGAWDYVDKYKDDEDVYISFTEIDKIGINPQSKYNTPVGIYTYPLKEFIENYCFNPPWENNKYNKTVGSYAPFAGNAKYVNFIRCKDKANFIEDMYRDYGSDDYDRDIKILTKTYEPEFDKKNTEEFLNFINKLDATISRVKRKDYADDLDAVYMYIGSSLEEYEITLGYDKYLELQELAQKYYLNEDEKIFYNIFKSYNWNKFIKYASIEAKAKNPVVIMWNITRLLAEKLSNNAKQASTKWNLILSKDLGYSGFADKSGKGYIHPSEPMQAVFFNTRAFDVITRVENIPAKKKIDINDPKELIKY